MQGTGGDIFEEGNGKSITLRLVRVLVWNISSSISSLLQYPLTPPSACTFDLGTERCACPPTERDKLNVPLVNEMQLIFPNELLDCDIEWIDSKLAGTSSNAATPAQILEECILDDEDGKCERFSDALEKLDELLGVVAKEQF